MPYTLTLTDGSTSQIDASICLIDGQNNLHFEKGGTIVTIVASDSWQRVDQAPASTTPGTPGETVAVPDWIGKFHEVDESVDGAPYRGKLFFVNATRAPKPGETLWDIVELDPAPGTVVPVGTHVTKWIADPNLVPATA
ncbi:hypothetical protein H9623_07000 [Oerskovia sp. Sa1BUA8]|uniref:Uncharacterized protein n=1 Tax=Oerskovia douganii TaxID=2762210 RepID=A0A9D5U7Q2_9CELL|nr:hypothetical protein [Oerskovia douganii]MBE7700053.1 hypothetical protein [Oerskovia douganii]